MKIKGITAVICCVFLLFATDNPGTLFSVPLENVYNTPLQREGVMCCAQPTKTNKMYKKEKKNKY